MATRNSECYTALLKDSRGKQMNKIVNAIMVFSLTAAPALASPQTGNTADKTWTSFSNDYMGMAVKHPQDWSVKTGQDTGSKNISSVNIMEPSANVKGKVRKGVSFCITKNSNEKGAAIADWYNNNLKNAGPAEAAKMKATPCRIGNSEAIMRQSQSPAFGKQFTYYAAVHKNDVLVVSATQPENSQDMDKTLGAILNTLQIAQ